MEILVARSAGYCMGVRRAMEIGLETAQAEGRTVYTYGPLIHNPQALEELRQNSVFPLSETEPIPRAPVIIRAHGVSPEVRLRLEREAEKLVDATCPKVATIQRRIRDYTERGYTAVIAGDPDHPEVVGLRGYARGDAYVVSTPAEVDALPGLGRVVLVAQTTQDEEIFEEIRAHLLARFPQGEALDTICESTHRRQSEVRELARKVDGLVVIGGKNSANTRRLAAIAGLLGVTAYHVETPGELPLEKLAKLPRVGITAGASTPSWIIEEVVQVLSSL